MYTLSEISYSTWIRTTAINAEQKLIFFLQKEQMDAYKYRNDDISLITKKKSNVTFPFFIKSRSL